MGLFDFLNNVPQSQNNQSQPPPVPWNTRTPMPTSSPSPSNGSSWNTRIPFTPSPPDNTQPSTSLKGFFSGPDISSPFSSAQNWQQNMQNLPQSQPQQSEPSAAPSSGGGFFSNLWNDVTGAMSGVGNALTGNNDPNQPHGMDRWQQVAQDLLHPGQMLQHNIDAIKNIPSALMEGFSHPDQASQGWDQGINKDSASLPAGASQILKYGVGGLNNPLTIMPVGKIFQGLKYGADAAHVTPYVSAAADAVKASPIVNNSVVNGAKDTLGTLFKKAYGTMADTQPTMDAMKGNMAADQYAIQQKMAELAKTHDLSPDELAQLPHVIEGKNLETKVGDLVNPTGKDGTILSENPVKVTDIKFDNNGQKWIQTELGHSYFPENQIQHLSNDKINQAAQELKDILSGGFNSVHGKVYGTDAELRNSHISPTPSLQDILNGNAGSSIRQGSVENYFPHRYNNTPEEIAAALQKANEVSNPGKTGFTTNGAFNQKRSFSTLQEAIDHGLKPEMNPYVATGQRLGETSKSIRNDEAIKQLLYSGVVDKTPAAGKVASTIKPFDPHVINVTDPQGGTKGMLQNYFMNPRDQSAIKEAIDPTQRNNLLDKATSIWKKYNLMNSAIHTHNINFNGVHLGGADLGDAINTMKDLRNGTTNPWYQRALASGAVSSDTLGSKPFSEALHSAVSTDKPSLGQSLKDKAGYALHGALWDEDKGLRTSLFRQAVEGGATDAEAAKHANKFMVDYNNTTPFENSVMKRIFPFYSWMKGNLPLQAEQWVNSTPKQMAALNTVKGLSDLMSGNAGKDGKMDTGQVLPDGSKSMIDPYYPGAELSKGMRDGALPFAFSKINPIYKEILSQVFNKAYYPAGSLAPNGKESMADATIRNPQAPAGHNAILSTEHALNSLLPSSGVMGSLASGLLGGTDSRGVISDLGSGLDRLTGGQGSVNKDKPPVTPLELLTKALGGFSSRDNPAKDALGAKYDNKNSILNHIKYEKEAGIPVSKAEKKAAYRKIR